MNFGICQFLGEREGQRTPTISKSLTHFLSLFHAIMLNFGGQMADKEPIPDVWVVAMVTGKAFNAEVNRSEQDRMTRDSGGDSRRCHANHRGKWT